MIDAKDCIAGCWFNRNVKGIGIIPFQLDASTIGKIFSDDASIALNDFYPIPLSEELLIKAGFEKIENHHYWHSRNEGATFYNLNGFIIWEKNGKYSQYYDCEDDQYSWVGGNIENVHTLQNKFYYYVGKEITIEL